MAAKNGARRASRPGAAKSAAESTPDHATAAAGTEEIDGLVYVRIADNLRERILSGRLQHGERLPSETQLGLEFGASRTSVREALRVLVSQRLIQTTRGATGGSIVRQLDNTAVMEMLTSNMRSMVVAQSTTRAEMEELREILEVTATWIAAGRRTPENMARIWAGIPTLARGEQPTVGQTPRNLGFHYAILAATENRLLHTFSEPILLTINSAFREQNMMPLSYYQKVRRQHIKIARAIEAKDQTAAAAAMTHHVAFLRQVSELPAKSAVAGLTMGKTTRASQRAKSAIATPPDISTDRPC